MNNEMKKNREKAPFDVECVFLPPIMHIMCVHHKASLKLVHGGGGTKYTYWHCMKRNTYGAKNPMKKSRGFSELKLLLLCAKDNS